MPRFGSRQNKGPRHQDIQTPELEDLKKQPSSSNQAFATKITVAQVAIPIMYSGADMPYLVESSSFRVSYRK